MALKDMWCFDHLAYSTPLNLGNYLTTLPGLLGIPGATLSYAGTINTYGFASIDTAGWFETATSGASTTASDYMPALSVPIANLFDTTKARSWVGFRTKSDGSALMNYSTPLFSVSSVVGGVAGSSAYVFTEADAATLANMALNKEYFIEICFDRTNSQFLVYVDGILRKTFATDPKTYNAGWMLFGPGVNILNAGANSYVANRHFRDFYFIDDLGDNSVYSTRLGPGRLSLATLAAVVATNAIVNNGGATAITTALQAFQASISSTPPTATLTPQTPNITTSSSYDPITSSFSAPASSAPILAVMPFDAISNQQTGNGTLLPSLVQGSNTVALAKQAFTDQTMNFTRKMAIQTAAPDGGAWTPAKVAATNLVLTPGP